MVLGQDCRVGAASLPTKFCDGCSGVQSCVVRYCHKGATLPTLFLWDKLDEGKHSDFVVFQYSS